MSVEATAKPAENMNITPPFAYGDIVPLNKTIGFWCRSAERSPPPSET